MRPGHARAVCGGLLLGVVWAAAALAEPAPAAGPPVVLGWRGDGTGVFPEATPALEWGRWPESPNDGLAYQLARPAEGDSGANATAVQSRQILEWLVIGPFPAADPAKALAEPLLPNEGDVQPTAGEKVGDQVWTAHVSVNKEPGVGMDWIQLGNLVGKAPGNVAYAHNYLFARAAGTVVLHMDQNAGCKIWVNGKVVHDNPKRLVTMNNVNYICYAANEHWAGELPVLGDGGSQRIAVELQKGWNRILLKATGHVNLRFVEAPQTAYRSRNILWACPLPSFSNAQPILVGDRLFVMSESEDLLCIDKNTGKVLWKRSTFYTDCLSDAEKQADPALRQAAELTEKLRVATDGAERIALRNQIKKALAEADKTACEQDAAYAPIRALQAKLKDPDLPDDQRLALLGQIRGLLEKMEGPRENNPYYAAVVPLEEIANSSTAEQAHRDAARRKIEEVLAKAAPRPRFVPPLHSHIGATGFTTPTPCSDGKNVYLYLGWGIVASYDLEGNRRWASLATDLGGVGAFNNSAPILVGDKFILMRNVQMRAYDAASGKIAWTTGDLRAKAHVDVWHGFGTGGNYSASPCAFRVGDADVVYFNSALVNAATGQVYSQMVENFGSNPRGTPVVADGAVYYGVGTSMFRFPLPETLQEGMRLKRQDAGHYEGNVDTYSSVLVHDGLAYALRSQGKLWVYDAKTLAVVYNQQLDMDSYCDYDHPGVTPSLVLGGKHIFAFDNQGTAVVFEPGRQFKQVARNRIATAVARKYVLDPDEIFQAAPILQGDRMYLRGETHLYCVGAK